MVELDHPFQTGKPLEENWEAILDLERLVPCVEGGSVTEHSEGGWVINLSPRLRTRLGRPTDRPFPPTTRLTDREVIDGTVNSIGASTIDAGRGLRQIQTGRVQNYALGIAIGFIVMAGSYLLLVGR